MQQKVAPILSAIEAPSRVLNVLTLGSCRIHNPLRAAGAAGACNFVYDKLGMAETHYFHTAGEALQFARFVRGDLQIPPSYFPLIFLHGVFRIKQEARRLLDGIDLVMVEICGDEEYISNGVLLHINELQRNFFEKGGPAVVAWRYALMRGEPATDHFDLALAEVRDRGFEPSEQVVDYLRAMRIKKLTAVDIEASLVELSGELQKPIMVVTHCDATGRDGQPILRRRQFIDVVKAGAKAANIPVFEPGSLCKKYGQNLVLENGGQDVLHIAATFLETAGIEMLNFGDKIVSAASGMAGATSATTPPAPSIVTSPAPSEKQALVQAARDWGYFGGAIKTRKDLWQGRRILDIGMGAGPHSISFIEGGAAGYVGVDPLVGSDHVRDFRSMKDPAIPAYHAFPHNVNEIMRIYPNIKLYSGLLEDVAAEVKANKADVAMMAAVTEHLTHSDKVIQAIWEILDRNGLLWISHCNWYSWTGHHRNPRSVASWNRSDAEQNKHIDWQHLEPTHPDYSNPNFNRIRLEDLRLIIAKYFEIIEWKVAVEGLPRLTPELRKKWKKYSLAELLGQNVYITGRRRDVPLDIDFTGRQFHHPSESYKAGTDFLHEDIATYELANSVYFTPNGEICSHSDNDKAGLRVFKTLKPGDVIIVTKFTQRLAFTVKDVLEPKNADPRITVVEPIPADIKTGNYDQWTIQT